MRKLSGLKTNSLIVRLIGSFLIVILLLVSFNFYTFFYFRDHMSREIIHYNNANLTSTTERFEAYFELLAGTLLRFYLNDKVRMMNKSSVDYNVADQLFRHEIGNLVLNQRMFLNNLIFHFDNDDFVLNHGGSVDASVMFTRLYTSDEYPQEFWERQFEQDYVFRVFPAAEFAERDIAGQPKRIGRLLPIIVKNKFHPDMYIAAFVDWDSIYREFHQSINENFYMWSAANEPLYASNATHTAPPVIELARGYAVEDSNYFFYEKGAYTGFTYINIIPYKHISSQLYKLTLTIVFLLVVAVLISLIASIWLSLKLYNPIRNIVSAIQQFNAEAAPRSQIHEFDLIGGNIRDLLVKNRNFHQSLHEQNSLLRIYAYMNKIKNIRHNSDATDWFDEERPFHFVLYQLTFTGKFREGGDHEAHKVSYFLKEYISRATAESYADAITFQTEHDQIMTIVFNGSGHETVRMLEGLKQTFDIDKAFYFLTIAVSSTYARSRQFSEAHSEARQLLRQRLLNGETQIIHGLEQTAPESVWLTQAREQEFAAQLQAGNGPGMRQAIERVLAAMHKKTAKAWQYRQLAEEWLKKTTSALVSLGVDPAAAARALPAQDDIDDCHTAEQYDRLFDRLAAEAESLLAAKSEEHDYIVGFVNRYLEKHYAEDITLDRVAEPLRVSTGYLSSYFKEKTGVNFIDYLHAIRIRKAKEALADTNLKIQEIAAQVGYLNLNSFNRMFKRLSGFTPSEYRQHLTLKENDQHEPS